MGTKLTCLSDVQLPPSSKRNDLEPDEKNRKKRRSTQLARESEPNLNLTKSDNEMLLNTTNNIEERNLSNVRQVSNDEEEEEEEDEDTDERTTDTSGNPSNNGKDENMNRVSHNRQSSNNTSKTHTASIRTNDQMSSSEDARMRASTTPIYNSIRSDTPMQIQSDSNDRPWYSSSSNSSSSSSVSNSVRNSNSSEPQRQAMEKNDAQRHIRTCTLLMEEAMLMDASDPVAEPLSVHPAPQASPANTYNSFQNNNVGGKSRTLTITRVHNSGSVSAPGHHNDSNKYGLPHNYNSNSRYNYNNFGNNLNPNVLHHGHNYNHNPSNHNNNGQGRDAVNPRITHLETDETTHFTNNNKNNLLTAPVRPGFSPAENNRLNSSKLGHNAAAFHDRCNSFALPEGQDYQYQRDLFDTNHASSQALGKESTMLASFDHTPEMLIASREDEQDQGLEKQTQGQGRYHHQKRARFQPKQSMDTLMSELTMDVLCTPEPYTGEKYEPQQPNHWEIGHK